jgi:hypothetical protein
MLAITDQIVQLLMEARDKIKDPDHWCRHSPACTANDLWANPHGADAVKWCAVGAIDACIPLNDRMANPKWMAAVQVLAQAAQELCMHIVMRELVREEYDDLITLPVRVNDYGTHAMVMAMFDQAIQTSLTRAAQVCEEPLAVRVDHGKVVLIGPENRPRLY